MNEDWEEGVMVGRGRHGWGVALVEGGTGAPNRIGCSGTLGEFPWGCVWVPSLPGVCCGLGFAQLPHLSLRLLVLWSMKS